MTAPAAPPTSSPAADGRPAHARPATRSRLRLPEWRTPSTATLVNALVIVAATVFVFKQLHPELLFRNTTTAGGDMGAHVWMPAYLRDHLLHHFRLTGWTPDWYAGFPAMVFYFPLPSLLIVLLDIVLPYAIAFKLITVLGVLTLPLCAFLFGRWSGMKDPGPACLAAATLPFLFDRTFTIYGGNIPSTLAGEFAFSISLSCMLLFLGIFARGLQTGRHRALASVLLAVTGLCHMIPAIFAVIGALVLLAFRFDRHRLKFAVPVFVTGGLLASFWSVPFLLRLPYTTDMGWEKITDFKKTLMPANFMWVFTLAAIGAIVSLLVRNRVGLFLAAMTIITGLMFDFAPQGRLWNARLLPFWFLWLWLLAGVTIAELGSFLAATVRRSAEPSAATSADVGEAPAEPAMSAERAEPIAHFVLLATPILAVVAALLFVGFPLRVLPGGTVGKDGKYHWLGITSQDRSFVPDWVKWNYSGYEDAGKSRRAEYQALVKTMTDIGATDGCGRAMWEYEAEEDAMGTPMALMLLPHWTDGCIGSMEGLFFESSATTPYHFLNQSELSDKPSRAMRAIPYRNLDVADGVDHLQLLGVRYYMAITPAAQAQADSDPNLQLITTSGPWTVHYSAGDQQRTWKIYKVVNSDLVQPLAFQPDVMTNTAKGGKDWLAAAVAWYNDRNSLDVPLAVNGPKEWKRFKAQKDPLAKNGSPGVVGLLPPEPPRVDVADPATVSNIKATDDSISFDVDKVGKPVLIKASYFPNWQASGAGKVYRVTPNQMVVVPTKKHVKLHYGYTPVDALGYLMTALGIAGVVVLWRLPPVEYPPPKRRRRRTAATEVPEGGSDGNGHGDYSAGLEHQLTTVPAGQNVDVDSYFDVPPSPGAGYSGVPPSPGPGYSDVPSSAERD